MSLNAKLLRLALKMEHPQKYQPSISIKEFILESSYKSVTKSILEKVIDSC